MTKIKKILLNPWVVGIGTTIIAAIVLKFIDVFTGTKILSILSKIIFSSFQYLKYILSFKVTVGTISITCFTVSIIYILAKRCIKRKVAKNNPPYLSYTEDIFQNITYRWEYNLIDGKYCIGSTRAYCSKCTCRIVHNECQKCNAVFIDIKDKEQLEAMIAYCIEKKFDVNEFKELGRQ